MNHQESSGYRIQKSEIGNHLTSCWDTDADMPVHHTNPILEEHMADKIQRQIIAHQARKNSPTDKSTPDESQSA